ncbi:MAG TPA: Gldg family protein [Steroidobacteraceae bacterium]|jgi:gliding motility-associatede transport system auxiliary component|nr:Gldg family protein [Steroidobacteraceae bacterium]
MTRNANMVRKTYGAGALLALAVLFIGVTIIISFVLRGARFDFTENGLYTIAPGTQNIVSSLKEPINLYFFFSQEATSQSPPMRAYAQRVREMLEEMQRRSKGKIKLSIIDPAPFSEDEDRATEFGLTAAPAGPYGESVYFGLAGTNSTDGREIIPLFVEEKEQFLEYDIASLIHRLSNPKKPTVGILSTLPVDASFDQFSGRMQEGWASIAQLREVVQLRTLAPDIAKIDADVELLLLIHPKDLPAKTLYAIDQFVMRGGKLIAFVDPQSENDPAAQQGGPMAMAPRSSSLGPLLDAWGVAYDPGKVVGDRGLGLTVRMRQDQQPSQHIGIIGLNRDSMDAKDVVTSALNSINVWTAGALKKKDGATIQFEPLLQSSSDAALLPVMQFSLMSDPQALLDNFKPSGERYTIAARVHGKLKSAYPNGAPPAEGEAAPKPAAGDHKTESAGDADLIVVADSDILADQMWVQIQNVFGQRLMMAVANNGDFLSNAVDNLAGSSDLISIRGRQSFFRPFTKVDELRRHAGEQLSAKEKELDTELKQTEQRLTELEAGRNSSGGSLVLTPEQQAEITRFQQERLRVRKELRDVRRGLDVEIKDLGWWIKLLNIAAVPALLAIGAILLALTRRRRLRAGRAAAHTG